MPHRTILLITLLTVGSVGAATILLPSSPPPPGPSQVIWWLFLVILPLALASLIVISATWAAMLCVVYGTVGLALDLATVISILGANVGLDFTLALSLISGSANFALIVFGGRAFWAGFEERRPPGSRPPSPPFPSSSSRA
jgi:hypothetical protein